MNLQEKGEHPLCGDGITECGYSYNPEYFMDNKSKSTAQSSLIQ